MQPRQDQGGHDTVAIRTWSSSQWRPDDKFDTDTVPADLRSRAAAARRARVEANRSAACGTCPQSMRPPDHRELTASGPAPPSRLDETAREKRIAVAGDEATVKQVLEGIDYDGLARLIDR